MRRASLAKNRGYARPNDQPGNPHLTPANVLEGQRASFAAAPETEHLRPTPESGLPKVILAGDWTRTGWPATLEGAVRSGQRAGDQVLASMGARAAR